MTEPAIERQIDNLDVDLFRHINSQTTREDRRGLLSLQSIVRAHFTPYVYLEIGSHLGGSIQPHLVDSRCELIYSIDPRPRDPIPDERSEVVVQYPANSTEAMMAGLSKIAHADLSKVVTFEKDASQVSAADTPRSPVLSFIDGEHTNKAVVSDFHSCLARTAAVSVIAFHDCYLVSAGILECAKIMRERGVKFQGFHFNNSAVYAYAIGDDARLSARFAEPLWRPGLKPLQVKAAKEWVKTWLPRSVVKALEG